MSDSPLRAVSSELPDPPYIDDIHVNEFVTLLVLSFFSTPVGSFKDDDEHIARRINMPLSKFEAHRDILMCGWVKHSNGRLYHPLVTEIVLKILDWRAQEHA